MGSTLRGSRLYTKCRSTNWSHSHSSEHLKESSLLLTPLFLSLLMFIQFVLHLHGDGNTSDSCPANSIYLNTTLASREGSWTPREIRRTLRNCCPFFAFAKYTQNHRSKKCRCPRFQMTHGINFEIKCGFCVQSYFWMWKGHVLAPKTHQILEPFSMKYQNVRL